MKIQAVSDLHLEFGDYTIPNAGCDVLVIAGDAVIAGVLKKENAGVAMRKFFQDVSNNFAKVIYIAGNHEYYHGVWETTLDVLQKECSKYDNIYMLEDDYIIIDDVVFVGSTLWTDMNKKDPITMHTVGSNLNDYKKIRKEVSTGPYGGYPTLSPYDTIRKHDRSLKVLKECVKNHTDKKVVVVSHHTPSAQSVHPRYRNDLYMAGGYASELGYFIADNPHIRCWLFGHTHYYHRYYIGDTLMVCNPRGYVGYEETGWNPNLIIDLDNLPTKFDGVQTRW